MSDTVNVYDASETRKGVSEIATQEEVNTGTDDFRYVTPKKLKIVTNEINTTIQNNYETLDTKIDDEISRAKNKETEINNDLTTHKNSTNNPHNVTPAQLNVYTKTEVDNLILELTKNYNQISETIIKLNERLTKLENNIDGGNA